MREAREETLGALRQTCKTASMVLTTAAERQRAVRCQTQPAEDRQFTLALVQASPRTLGEFDPRGQIPPQRLFSFGPCTARFLFSAQPKRENGGCIAQPSSWLKSPPPARASSPPQGFTLTQLSPSRALATSPSTSRAASALRTSSRSGLVAGCLGVKTVQQSS